MQHLTVEGVQSHLNTCLDALEKETELWKEVEADREDAEKFSQKIQRRKYECPLCLKNLDHVQLGYSFVSLYSLRRYSLFLAEEFHI
jgi:DNA repair exonuclease SbcCD ATPase subunit